MVGTGVVEVPVPADAGAVVDAAPVTTAGAPAWLLLGADGHVGRWDPRSGGYERLAVSSVPPEAERDRWADRVPRPRLHACADGGFAAVVHDYGQFGQVLDLRTGEVTMTLDNTGYQEETVPFSLAFLERPGRTAVVHRTAWNRLDVSDAATGELLTPRTVRSADAAPGRPPEHYLDYFHGALYLSPDGRHILDDGWFWHPLGLPVVWSVERWLTGDVWESEDAPQTVCGREYYWDHAMTWIDATRVAVEGIGDDDAAMRPGARVFDITRTEQLDQWRDETIVEVATVPGASDRLFSDGSVLYSADAAGLHSWDPVGGERLGTVPGFTPAHRHPSGTFLELRDGTARTLRL